MSNRNMVLENYLFAFAIAGVVLLSWLYLGVYNDREWGELNLFLKHRPTFKVYFHAPLGESDRKINELPERLQMEERAYVEFVEKGGGYKRMIMLPIPH